MWRCRSLAQAEVLLGPPDDDHDDFRLTRVDWMVEQRWWLWRFCLRFSSSSPGARTGPRSRNRTFNTSFGILRPSPSLLEHPQAISGPNKRTVGGGGRGTCHAWFQLGQILDFSYLHWDTFGRPPDGFGWLKSCLKCFVLVFGSGWSSFFVICENFFLTAFICYVHVWANLRFWSKIRGIQNRSGVTWDLDFKTQKI